MQYLEQADLSFPALRDHIEGEVIGPSDAGYDDARAVYYGIDRRPAVIVRPANADEVAYVISVARDTGSELAVRSGGHSLAGHSVTDGGIVLDLSLMKGLEIAPDEGTAWAEAGLTAGELTEALGEHGLAVGFGDSGTVGIGGITLGGGVGFLARKHGLTIDSLLAAEVVTADGRVIEADEVAHPDLFWAIRGGGGNFGVVTRFKFRLAEVDQVYGGMIFLPATPDVLRSFIELADQAPEELSSIGNVMLAPPMPFLPEELHGTPIMLALMMYAGDPARGEEVLAPFRALGPIADMVQPMRYPEIYALLEEGGPEVPAGFVVRNIFLNDFDEESAAAIVEQLAASSANMAVAQLRVLGGAIDRVPAEATAFGHRNRRIMANVAAMYEDVSQAGVHQAWADNLAKLLRRDATGAYVNFIADEGEDRIREAYPEATWARLREVKRRYDPTNLFRLNQNIPPAR